MNQPTDHPQQQAHPTPSAPHPSRIHSAESQTTLDRVVRKVVTEDTRRCQATEAVWDQETWIRSRAGILDLAGCGFRDLGTEAGLEDQEDSEEAAR